MPPGRRIALLTSNARKGEEWRIFLRTHGWQLEVFEPKTQVERLLADFAVVCRDQSRLVLPGSDEDAPLRHLLPVDHLCQIRCWEGDGVRDFSARRAGYLDLSQEGESGGWWDTQFRDARTGRSYSEQSLTRVSPRSGGTEGGRITRGAKLSARAAALEQLMEHLSPGPRQAQHLTVDLGHLVSETVDANPCFAALQGSPLQGILRAALNRGLFFCSARTRPQQVYFWPGISGLPSVPRESVVDEAKFLFHDLVHFLIGRLPPTGALSEAERKVFLLWAMIEESVALMLADGLFVDRLRLGGVKYDFQQHKGYAFYQALGLAGRSFSWEELVELLWANTLFFTLGDRSGFAGADAGDPRVVRYFEGFERFAMGDWLWNERMSLYVASSSDFYQRWWRLARPLAESLGVNTPAEVAAGLDFSVGDRALLRQVFDILVQRLRAWSEPPAAISSAEESKRARRRWLLGQFGFFAAFDHLPAVRQAGQLLRDCGADVEVGPLVRQTLETARDLGECSSAEVEAWTQFFPLFPPYYVGYKERPGLTVGGLAARILGSPASLSERLANVSALICTRDRFLVRGHQLPGGPREHEHEVAETAWRRLATEWWGAEVAARLASRARRCQMGDVLLIELEESEFEVLPGTRAVADLDGLSESTQTVWTQFSSGTISTSN